MAELPLLTTLLQGDLQLSILHNIILRLTSGAPSPRFLSLSLSPLLTDRITSPLARPSLLRILERLRRASGELKVRWRALRSHWGKVDEEHPLRKRDSEELERIEHAVVEREFGRVGRRLERGQFEGAYRQIARKILNKFDVDEEHEKPKLDRSELDLLRRVIGLEPGVKEGWIHTEGLDVPQLLLRLVDALIILFRAQPKTGPKAGTATLAEKLVALSALIRSFASEPSYKKLFIDARYDSAKESKAALEAVAIKLLRSARELRGEWDTLHATWAEVDDKHPLRGEHYDDQLNKERVRVRDGWRLAVGCVDHEAVGREYHQLAQELLNRFDTEPGLDQEAQRHFRVTVHLQPVKPEGIRRETISPEGLSTLALLKALLKLKAIESVLSPKARDPAEAFRRVLRPTASSPDLRRRLTKARAAVERKEVGSVGGGYVARMARGFDERAGVADC